MEGRCGPDHPPRELFLGRSGRGHREDRALPRVPLGCGQAVALQPRGGVSTILGVQTPTALQGARSQAPAPAAQPDRERRCCPAPWLATADDPDRTWSCWLPLASQQPCSWSDCVPSKHVPEEVPSQTARNLQHEQETCNCWSQLWLSESVVTVKATGSVDHRPEHQPLLGMQIPGPRSRPAELNNLGEAPSSAF